jgi:hypothetical protein
MLPVRPLRSTGVTPLPRYYGPLRLPARAVPRLCIPSGRWGSIAFPRPAGSPRFLDRSIPARCPQPPRKVRRVLAPCFPADIRLHHLWQTGHLHWRNEAESGSLALRLAGLLPRFPPDGLPRLAPVRLHARMSNLHGELLSVHKISQAWPGIPETRRNSKRKERTANSKSERGRGAAQLLQAIVLSLPLRRPPPLSCDSRCPQRLPSCTYLLNSLPQQNLWGDSGSGSRPKL